MPKKWAKKPQIVSSCVITAERLGEAFPYPSEWQLYCTLYRTNSHATWRRNVTARQSLTVLYHVLFCGTLAQEAFRTNSHAAWRLDEACLYKKRSYRMIHSRIFGLLGSPKASYLWTETGTQEAFRTNSHAKRIRTKRNVPVQKNGSDRTVSPESLSVL